MMLTKAEAIKIGGKVANNEKSVGDVSIRELSAILNLTPTGEMAEGLYVVVYEVATEKLKRYKKDPRGTKKEIRRLVKIRNTAKQVLNNEYANNQ